MIREAIYMGKDCMYIRRLISWEGKAERDIYIKLRKRRDLDISAASYRMLSSKQICCIIDAQRNKVAHERPTKVRVSCCHRTLVVVLFLWVCGGYVQIGRWYRAFVSKPVAKFAHKHLSLVMEDVRPYYNIADGNLYGLPVCISSPFLCVSMVIRFLTRPKHATRSIYTADRCIYSFRSKIQELYQTIWLVMHVILPSHIVFLRFKT